jgi:hypothetical protein
MPNFFQQSAQKKKKQVGLATKRKPCLSQTKTPKEKTIGFRFLKFRKKLVIFMKELTKN